MAEDGFNDLKLLSQKNLIEEALRKILETYAELRRREKVTKDFLKSLCDLSVETRVWWILFEASGAQRWSDIFRVADCSGWKLNDVLQELLREGLVRMVENQYQAIVPPELVQFLN